MAYRFNSMAPGDPRFEEYDKIERQIRDSKATSPKEHRSQQSDNRIILTSSKFQKEREEKSFKCKIL